MKKCNNKLIKLIRRERIKKRKRERVGRKWMMWPLMWLNRNIATTNVSFNF